MPGPRWIKGSPGGTQPCSLVTHGCGTPSCKALSQRSRGGLGRSPAHPPSLPGCGQEPREEAIGVGGFYFPPSKHPALVMAGNLLLAAAFRASQPLWQDGQGRATAGASSGPRCRQRMLHEIPPAGSSGCPGASACRSPLTQGCTQGLGSAGRVSLGVLPRSSQYLQEDWPGIAARLRRRRLPAGLCAGL